MKPAPLHHPPRLQDDLDLIRRGGDVLGISGPGRDHQQLCRMGEWRGGRHAAEPVAREAFPGIPERAERLAGLECQRARQAGGPGHGGSLGVRRAGGKGE